MFDCWVGAPVIHFFFGSSLTEHCWKREQHTWSFSWFHSLQTLGAPHKRGCIGNSWPAHSWATPAFLRPLHAEYPAQKILWSRLFELPIANSFSAEIAWKRLPFRPSKNSRKQRLWSRLRNSHPGTGSPPALLTIKCESHGFLYDYVASLWVRRAQQWNGQMHILNSDPAESTYIFTKDPLPKSTTMILIFGVISSNH